MIPVVPTRKRPTIRDVAREAGVSVPTTLVLRGSSPPAISLSREPSPAGTAVPARPDFRWTRPEPA
jgi:hypothetical protein